jgi:hypothetical protein
MSEPIVTRERIARDADEAACEFVRTGRKPANPYPIESDAHREWSVSFARYLLAHSAPDAEASA